MKTTLRLRRTLLPVLIVLAGMAAAPQSARADLIDDFAWVLDQVPGVFPVSGKDIQDSRALFEDLANVKTDTDVAKVLEKHKDTALGKQATSAVGGVPTWFWDLIDTYIALRTDDFWGVVAHLGEAAICVVAQVMTGGSIDVCGLIEELVKVGKALLDAATAVAEFFASVGEGAWEAAKDFGCSIGLGGCDEGSPPEQIAYAWVFAPEVPAGLTARKALDPSAFETLRKLLEEDAKAKPFAKLHYPGMENMKIVTLGDTAVSIASGAYVKAVDAQWSADMATNVLPQLAKKRSEYDNPQQVAAVAAKAAVEYAKNPKTPPYTWVRNLCADDFSKGFGVAHVDRWIAAFPGSAKGLGDVKTHAEWCISTFWAKNKDKFGQHFRAYAQANYCPAFGQTLMCPTVAEYESCTGLLGSSGLADQCGINVASAGKEAAEKIYASMKAKGSKIPCKIVTDGQIFGSKPADLVCPRPTQGHACGEIGKSLFAAIPVKLVNCVVEETAEYKTLRSKVAGAVVALNQQYPDSPNGIPFAIDLVDPLIVHAPSVVFIAKVQESAPTFGFGPPSVKAGFDYFTFQLPHTIDGVSTPALGMDVKLPTATQGVQLDKMQEKVALVSPGDPDPTGKLSSKTGAVTVAPSAALGAAKLQTPAPTKPMSGSLPPGSGPGAGGTGSGAAALKQGVSAQAKAAPGAVFAPPSPSFGGAAGPAPTKPMSGDLPPGSGRGAGTAGRPAVMKGTPAQAAGTAAAASASKSPSIAGAPAPAPTSGPAPVPGGRLALQGSVRAAVAADIKSGPRVLVAGKHPVAWEQGIVIPDADARRKTNGICDVALGHDTINAGSAASGPFGRRWANPQNPAPFTDTYPSIPAGGSLSRTDTLPLKPGANHLTLALDPMNQVKESNEGDNLYTLTITVNGTCGLVSPAPASTPGRGVQAAPSPAAGTGAQTAPATRLPAVQQPQVSPSPIQPRGAAPRQ